MSWRPYVDRGQAVDSEHFDDDRLTRDHLRAGQLQAMGVPTRLVIKKGMKSKVGGGSENLGRSLPSYRSDQFVLPSPSDTPNKSYNTNQFLKLKHQFEQQPRNPPHVSPLFSGGCPRSAVLVSLCCKGAPRWHIAYANAKMKETGGARSKHVQDFRGSGQHSGGRTDPGPNTEPRDTLILLGHPFVRLGPGSVRPPLCWPFRIGRSSPAVARPISLQLSRASVASRESSPRQRQPRSQSQPAVLALSWVTIGGQLTQTLSGQFCPARWRLPSAGVA